MKTRYYIVALLFPVACQPAQEGSVYRYSCGQYHAKINFDAGTGNVSGIPVKLAPAASGVRFASDDEYMAFWEKGDDAKLVIDNHRIIIPCSEISAGYTDKE